MLKSWKKFLNERIEINVLKYYVFDWDDNILKMETPLHFKYFDNGEWVNRDITPEEFSKVRKKYPTNYMDNDEWKGDPAYSFIEFRDFGPRKEEAFIQDVKKSIADGCFGPSWEVFLNVLKEGRLFAIVTTRGHEPWNLRRGIEWIIDNVLKPREKQEMLENIVEFNKIFHIQTDDLIGQYLNECYFMGLNSKAFIEEFKYFPHGVMLNKGKQDAINKFVQFVRGFAQRTKLPIKVGFSDDDINFTKAAKEMFMNMEKSLTFPENFYIFDTSDPTIKGGVKTKI
jgi:hypothetical protein